MAKNFERKTPFKQVHDYLVETGACQEALDFYQALLDAKPNLTFGEALDNTAPGDLTLDKWFSWLYRQIYDQSAQDVRDSLILKVQDPMRALKVCCDCTTMVQADKAALENKFRGILTKAEQEYDDGILTQE